jgi:hypothetical protein
MTTKNKSFFLCSHRVVVNNKLKESPFPKLMAILRVSPQRLKNCCPTYFQLQRQIRSQKVSNAFPKHPLSVPIPFRNTTCSQIGSQSVLDQFSICSHMVPNQFPISSQSVPNLFPRGSQSVLQ